MRAHRTLALLATTGIMLVAVAGGVLTAPGGAAAAPHKPSSHPTPYPAPPPVVTIKSGSVKVGHSVRARGKGFDSREQLTVRIKTRLTLGKFHGPTITQDAGRVRTDKKGKFEGKINFSFAGYATVTFTSTKTGRSGSATVHVVGWTKGWPRQFRETDLDLAAGPSTQTADRAPNQAGTALNGLALAAHHAALPAKAVSRSGSGGSPEAQLLVGLLGAVGLFGSGLVALRSTRRRRDSA